MPRASSGRFSIDGAIPAAGDHEDKSVSNGRFYSNKAPGLALRGAAGLQGAARRLPQAARAVGRRLRVAAAPHRLARDRPRARAVPAPRAAASRGAARRVRRGSSGRRFSSTRGPSSRTRGPPRSSSSPGTSWPRRGSAQGRGAPGRCTRPPGCSPAGPRSPSTRPRRSCSSSPVRRRGIGAPLLPFAAGAAVPLAVLLRLQRGPASDRRSSSLRRARPGRVLGALGEGPFRVRRAEPDSRWPIPASSGRGLLWRLPSGSGSCRGFCAWRRSGEDRADWPLCLAGVAGLLRAPLRLRRTGTAAGRSATGTLFRCSSSPGWR